MVGWLFLCVGAYLLSTLGGLAGLMPQVSTLGAFGSFCGDAAGVNIGGLFGFGGDAGGVGLGELGRVETAGVNIGGLLGLLGRRGVPL